MLTVSIPTVSQGRVEDKKPAEDRYTTIHFASTSCVHECVAMSDQGVIYNIRTYTHRNFRGTSAREPRLLNPREDHVEPPAWMTVFVYAANGSKNV